MEEIGNQKKIRRTEETSLPITLFITKVHKMYFVDFFQEKANVHNEQLVKVINDTLVNGIVAEIDKIDVYSSELRLERVFRILEKAALQKVFHFYIHDISIALFRNINSSPNI